MDKPLKLLIIEGEDKTVVGELQSLKAAGYRVAYSVAVTETEMSAALAEEAFDMVITDHDLPQFDSTKAQAVLKQSGLDIPFIIVANALDDETAVALIKGGAHDYVKKEKLSNLVSAVECALKDREDQCRRREAEKALTDREEKYRLLADNAVDGMWLLDMNLKLIYCNPASEKQSGFTLQEIMEMSLENYFTPESLKVVAETFLVDLPKLEADPDYNPVRTLELEFYKKDGTVFWAEAKFNAIRDKQGKPIYIIGEARDINERKQLEQKLEEMATHDFLTGLPNRVLLFDRFNVAASLAHRNKARLAVMSLDLDNFKTINDTLGHDVGDQVLKAVGKRLTATIRASDTVARIGGDEFTLVMMETKHVEDATAIAQKMLDSFIEPLSIDGHQLHITISIGITICPEDSEDMETLIRKSDAAMYYSKSHGGNQFNFYGDGCPH